MKNQSKLYSLMIAIVASSLQSGCSNHEITSFDATAQSSNHNKPNETTSTSSSDNSSTGNSSIEPTASENKPVNQATTNRSSKEPELTTTQTSVASANKKIVDLNFDDFKFPIEKDGKFDRKLLTKKIEGYVGKKIRIRGYMHPMVFKKTGIKSFIFVRDDQECCFGPGAALYDCMAVLMKPGKSANFSIRPITIEGDFTIKEFRQRGKVRAVFLLRADSVK